jgi:hypothetical protein
MKLVQNCSNCHIAVLTLRELGPVKSNTSVSVSNIKYIGIYCCKVTNGTSATGLYYQIVTESAHNIETL